MLIENTIDKTTLRKTGIITFIVLVIILFIIIIFIIAGLTQRYYPLKVKFRFIGDLRKGAPVKFLGGMPIGYVKDIYISGNYVEVLLYIRKGFRIKEGSEFSIYSVGFVGARYVEVDPPAIKISEKYLTPGSIVWGNDAMGIEIIQQNLARLSKKFVYSRIKSPPPLPVLLNRAANSLYLIRKKLELMRPQFRDGLEIANANVLKVLLNIKEMEQKLKNVRKRLKAVKKEDILNYFSFILQTENIINELNNSLKSVADISEKLTYRTEKVRKKETSIGRLIYDDETYDNLVDITEKMCETTEEWIKKPIFFK